MAPDLADILLPGRTLSRADVEALEAALGEEPWRTRQRRLEARDDAVCTAMAATGARAPTVAAVALENALRRLSAGGPVSPPELRLAAGAVLTLNAGRPLGWRQLLRIEAGSSVQISCGDDSEPRRTR